MDCPKFELVSKYTDQILLPKRATAGSAGYDFVVAKDTIVPSYYHMLDNLKKYTDCSAYSLEGVSALTKKYSLKPTLVPTGVKAYIPQSQYLQLSVRSSCPLKNWLILANGVGIIDADYYNNESNEGEIFFQIINLFPEDIILHKGDKIGQGIFLDYYTVKEDLTLEKRLGGFGSTSK